MSDKNDENKFDEFNDDIEYQFEDDNSVADDDVVDEGSSLEEADADAVVDAGGAGKIPGGGVAAIAGGMGGKMKPVFMGVGVIILIAIMYIMLGGGSNNDATGVDTQFVANSAKNMGETPSPFESQASDQASMQDDFLAELDITPDEEKAEVVEVVQEKPKEPEVAVVSEDQLDHQLGLAIEDLKQDLRNEFGKAVVALKNQDEKLGQDLQARYDDKVMQAEMKVAELNKQNDATLSELDTLHKELASVKAELLAVQKQQLIATKNQKRIMYNQGMSFNASGQAMTRIGDDEVPMAEATKQTIQNNIVYNVQAVVPGRAWLMNDAGKSVTVAVGDKLPGFGVVVDIDALNGVVVTSSGKLLTTTQ
jgi:hypothetical protein